MSLPVKKLSSALAIQEASPADRALALDVAERAANIVNDGALSGVELEAFEAAVDLTYDERRVIPLIRHALPFEPPTEKEVLATRAQVRDIARGTGLRLSRPVGAQDRSWRVTRLWTPSEERLLGRFAAEYQRARLMAGDRIDCGDFPYEIVIAFAAQRGLPLRLVGGTAAITHATARPLATAQAMLNSRAITWSENTVPVSPSDARPGDIAVMARAQSLDGVNNGDYFHSYPIAGYDFDKREATVIYGSLADQLHPDIVTRFCERYGIRWRLATHFINDRGQGYSNVHDVEREIIDAVRADPSQKFRQQDAATYTPVIQRFLRKLGVPEDKLAQATTELVALVRCAGRPDPSLVAAGYPQPHALSPQQAVKQDTYVLRDAPTPIDAFTGREGFDAVNDRDLMSDPGRAKRVTQLLGAKWTPKVQTAKTDADAVSVAQEAVRVLDLRQDARALVTELNEARALRRWNFAAWNASVPPRAVSASANTGTRSVHPVSR